MIGLVDALRVQIGWKLGEGERLSRPNNQGGTAYCRNIDDCQKHRRCCRYKERSKHRENGDAGKAQRQQDARAVLIIDTTGDRRCRARAQNCLEQCQGGNQRRRAKNRLHECGNDDVHRENGHKGEHVGNYAYGEECDLERPQIDKRLFQFALAFDEKHHHDTADRD